MDTSYALGMKDNSESAYYIYIHAHTHMHMLKIMKFEE